MHTALKASKCGVISGPHFPVFSPNTGKYRPEIKPYLDTFHIVHVLQNQNIGNIGKSSVIRQKRESQNECFKKIKHVKFPKNEHFLPPDTHMYVCVSGG